MRFQPISDSMLCPDAKSWMHILRPEFEKPYFRRLEDYLVGELTAGKKVIPTFYNTFRALELTPFGLVRVVVIGQDPYSSPANASGLAFSVPPQAKLPPSLKNIFRTLKSDIGVVNKNGDLSSWAEQGILLLNTILTVEMGKPLSHANKGWELLTDKIISNVDAKATPIVWVLWGKEAQKKKKLITNPLSLIIEACHPSPLSAGKGGFFFHKPFSRVNKFLKANNIKEIDWKTK